MNKAQKINILGREYTFKKACEKTDDAFIETPALQGECRFYLGEIVIHKDLRPKEYEKFITRHEIIHAFLHESGLDGYKHNEDLINWVAQNFPKMLKVFKQVKGI